VSEESFHFLARLGTDASPVARGELDILLLICDEHNLAGIDFSVTGRGILSGRFAGGHTFEVGDIRRMDPLFQRERFDSALRVRQQLVSWVRVMTQQPLRWDNLGDGHQQVACALTGTSSPTHLAENLAACEIDLTQEHLDTLNAFLAEEDARLAAAQRVTVRHILETPLADAP
jgi:aryl-alcohol dehydrogenase-like predicted oxidoreductase